MVYVQTSAYIHQNATENWIDYDSVDQAAAVIDPDEPWACPDCGEDYPREAFDTMA